MKRCAAECTRHKAHLWDGTPVESGIDARQRIALQHGIARPLRNDNVRALPVPRPPTQRFTQRVALITTPTSHDVAHYVIQCAHLLGLDVDEDRVLGSWFKRRWLLRVTGTELQLDAFADIVRRCARES